MLTKEKYFDFNDVLIKANVSNVNSRSAVDLKFKSYSKKEVLKDWRPIPVMSANMDTITDIEMAFELVKNNWIAVLHKYVSIPDIKILFDKVDSFNKENDFKIDYRNIFISRGTTETDRLKLKERLEAEPRIKSVCIDVANGHRLDMFDYLKELKNDLCKDKILMAGNVGTEEVVKFYIEAGVDIIKAGIGPGCFTADMKVLTSNGLKNIVEIKVGDLVLTHKNRFQKVLNTMTYEEKDSIISINGIESTLNHKYYVINKSDKDFVNQSNLEKFAFWLPANQLSKENHLLIKINSMNFIEIINIEQKDFLGKVYDIEVEEDNSFTIEGIIVHNSACITRVKTGVGIPQVSLIDKLKTAVMELNGDILIASDGGCKTEGDIAKAFVAGTDFVMIGGMLAGYKESPGVIEIIEDKKYKRFSGMAAKESQHNGVPKHGTEEGKTVLVPYKGKVYHKLLDIEGGLRSAATYIGANNINEMYELGILILTNVQENKIFNKH